MYHSFFQVIAPKEKNPVTEHSAPGFSIRCQIRSGRVNTDMFTPLGLVFELHHTIDQGK